MMRILDIDNDFFLADVTHWREAGGQRLEMDAGFQPWSADEVRGFLESRCLLTADDRRPGGVFTEHVEVFDAWLSLISSGKLVPPFEVVHVDAHADLGLGDASYMYLAKEWLGRPLEERSQPERGGMDGLDSGNYLAFAAACRWISRLIYVHHPRGGNDVPRSLMRDWDMEAGALQLKFYGRDGAQDAILHGTAPPLSLEPEVPFIVVPESDYQAEEPFDMVFVAQSPSYTPPEADSLLNVVASYIEAS